MDSHQWFQQLRNALHEERVPAAYANRIMDELWLHYLETKEREVMNGFSGTESNIVDRLGSPQHIAAQAAQVPLATWTGRHPWLTFIFGPPLFTIGMMIVFVVVVMPFAAGKSLMSHPWLIPLMSAMGPVQVVAASVVASFFMLRLVGRSSRSPWWGVLSCGLIALLCAVAFIDWAPPAANIDTTKLTMGMGVLPPANRLLQSILPLTIGIIYAIRNRPRRQMPVEDAHSIPMQSAA